MDRKIGLSSRRARSNASSPQGYQSTGSWACWRRYGLFSPARRLTRRGSSAEREDAGSFGLIMGFCWPGRPPAPRPLGHLLYVSTRVRDRLPGEPPRETIRRGPSLAAADVPVDELEGALVGRHPVPVEKELVRLVGGDH